MKRALFTAVAIAAFGCGHAAYAGHYADLSIGHVACPRKAIVADDWDSNAGNGQQTWTVRCRGREYYCSTGGEGMLTTTSNVTSCVESAPEVSAAAHEQ